MNLSPQKDPERICHDDAYLQEYFEICKRIYEQMERDGTWPWETDSTNPTDMVDSRGTNDEI